MPEVTRQDLKRVEDRVEYALQEIEGEKLLSRYILQQSRQNGDDLAILKARVERVESELRGLRADLNASQQKLPGIIADVMREVMRESRS